MPMFGVAPEALDAVDMGFSLGNAFLHLEICPAQTKTGVSSTLIGVIQVADGGVGVDNGQPFGSAPLRDGRGPGMDIPIVYAV